MPLPEGLVAFLLNQSPITTLIGDRIQPVPAPEDLAQYPLITHQSVSDVPQDMNLDGPSGVTEMRIVLDCLAQRYVDARSLGRTVKHILNGYSGTLPDYTRIYLMRATLVDRFDDGSRIYCTSVHVLAQYED
jgi:hypothetical protein